MKKEFVEPKIDVILLDSVISTGGNDTLPVGGSGDYTDGDGL
ncbi:MAG: hypothetical protein ACOYA9_12190 [Bilifractor sp.]|jgi:hypothetical protein